MIEINTMDSAAEMIRSDHFPQAAGTMTSCGLARTAIGSSAGSSSDAVTGGDHCTDSIAAQYDGERKISSCQRAPCRATPYASAADDSPRNALTIQRNGRS